MGAIRDAANSTFRDYEVAGVPASGPHEPVKSEVRATFGVVEDRIDEVEATATVGVRWTTQNVRVRSTGNVVVASALENGDTLNGVTLATGDVVFLGSQTDPAENGLYTVPASGAAIRAAFADSAAELAHIGFLISEGTVGAGERWTLPLDSDQITVGTTALDFARIGIEVDVAAEVAEARGGEATLGDRIDAVDAKVRTDDASRLTAVGNGAALEVTTGEGVTALGNGALLANTTGDRNTATGDAALADNTTGDDNTAVGMSALSANVTGSLHSAFGKAAGVTVTGGSLGVFVGAHAGYHGSQKVDPQNVVVLGFEAYADKDNQAVLGNSAMTETKVFGELRGGYGGTERIFNDHGDNNFLLAGAGPADPVSTFGATGAIAIGKGAMENVTAGGNCIAIGNLAMQNGGGNDHLAIGVEALKNSGAATVGCTALGRQALKETTTGSNLTAVGDTALTFNTTGSASIAMGYGAAWKNTTGSNLVALGAYAGAYRQQSQRWTAIGYQSLAHPGDEAGAGTVNDTVAVGYMALYATLGAESVAVGSEAGRNHAGTTGRSVLVGFRAGQRLTGGHDNTFVGHTTGANAAQPADVTNATAIGAGAHTLGSNEVSLGNDDVETFRFGGVSFTKAQMQALLALVS